MNAGMTTQVVESPGYGISRYTLGNTAISVLASSSGSDSYATDLWIKVITDTINTFPHPTHAFVLLDLREIEVGPTPYQRARAADIFDNVSPNRVITFGLVMSNRLVSTLTSIFLTRLIERVPQTVTFESFWLFDDAADWLIQQRLQRGL